MTHWFSMGGYALYVWLSYGLVAAAMLGVIWSVRRAFKRVYGTLHSLKKTRETHASST